MNRIVGLIVKIQEAARIPKTPQVDATICWFNIESNTAQGCLK